MSNKFEELPPETMRQRRAIHLGLTSILTETEATAALESWSTYFSESGSVFSGLNAFARDICDSFGKTGQHRELVKALNRALLTKDSGTSNSSAAKKAERPSRAIPRPDISEAPAELAIDEEVISTPDFQTFQVLLLNLLRLVEENRDDLRFSAHRFLEEVIEHMPWSEAQQQQLMSLLVNGSTVQIRTYRADQLKAFLKHFRSWMADELGKAVASNLLKQALIETEVTAFGRKYSPNNFI
ncbi:MAG TPA: hypothetical protein VK949_04495 [Methylotenera sp.]|nr:hypothetical protein [Methylotenera sp.]